MRKQREQKLSIKRRLLWFFWAVALMAVILPPLDPYLDDSMTRLMLVQTPILILLGFLVGPCARLRFQVEQNWALAGLLIGLGMIMFWMIPRSVDLAVSSDFTDALMHLTLFCAGLALYISLVSLPLLIQMATGIYITSMGCTFGIILSQAAAKVCVRFTVEEQQAAGLAILWAFGFFLILHVVWSLWKLVQTGPVELEQ